MRDLEPLSRWSAVAALLLAAACEDPAAGPLAPPAPAFAHLGPALVVTGPGVTMLRLHSRGTALAINESGDVTGAYDGGTFIHIEGVGFDGSPFPAFRSSGRAITDRPAEGGDPTIFGHLRRSLGPLLDGRPMRWTPGDDEATPIGDHYGWITDATSSGFMVGQLSVGGRWEAVRWAPDGTSMSFGATAGDVEGIELNENGDVVFATAGNDIMIYHAATGRLEDTGLDGFAVDINASGQITGYYYEGSRPRGFVRDPDGTIRFLPEFVEGRGALPGAINDAGHVVGGAPAPFGTSFASAAFYYVPGCQLIQLAPPLSMATGLNEAGQATGTLQHFGSIPVRWDIDLAEACVPPFVNTAPVVADLPDALLIEGEVYAATGTFTDDDPDDAWTATVDFGEGGGAQPLTLYGQSFTLSHVYTSAGAFTLTVSVEDAAGATGTASATVEVQTPAQATRHLAATVDDLRSGGFLDPGNATALGSTLAAAARHLDRGNPTAAVRQLGAFINQVEALVRAGKLDGGEGDALIESADRIAAAAGADSGARSSSRPGAG